MHLAIDDLPSGLVAIPASIPDDVPIETVEIADLPRTWRRYPFPKATQAIGAAWMARGRAAVLSVPSVVVPLERNLLLNPEHPDFRRIIVEPSTPFSLDRRLAKG